MPPKDTIFAFISLAAVADTKQEALDFFNSYVEGANSYTAKPYRIYRGFSETGKFESATAIKVTVK